MIVTERVSNRGRGGMGTLKGASWAKGTQFGSRQRLASDTEDSKHVAFAGLAVGCAPVLGMGVRATQAMSSAKSLQHDTANPPKGFERRVDGLPALFLCDHYGSVPSGFIECRCGLINFGFVAHSQSIIKPLRIRQYAAFARFMVMP